MLNKALQAAAGNVAGDVAPVGAWDLSYASIPGASVDTDSIAPWHAGGDMHGLFFKADGTKMYVIERNQTYVHEYDLVVPWDILTLVYTGNFFYVAAQETSPAALFFKPDGTKMYVMGISGDDVNEYDLSVAWDVSTAVYSKAFSVVAQENSPYALFFKPDGTKMYVMGTTGDDVNEYNLSIPWDVSSAVYSQVFSVAAQETSPYGIHFNSAGTKMFICAFSNNITEYDLSVAWDVSTAVYFSKYGFYISSNYLKGIFLSSDETKIYAISSGTSIQARLYAFELYTPGTIYLPDRPVYSQRFYVGSQESNPYALFFKPDGTKMYVMGVIGDDVNEYDLSIPWDVSSAVYLQLFSIGAQESNPAALFFKPDGTKMYVMGTTGDDVNEYDLSIPWDVSSAVYSQVFYVGSQEGNPFALFFKPDGTKMYVMGISGDDVNEYDLSVAWDVSSAVYLQVFSVAAQELNPYALFFKDDGTKMYVMGGSNRAVYAYDLSVAWDVSSAVYSQVFSVIAQELNPYALFFKPDGTKMYVVGTSSDYVYEYDLPVAWSMGSTSHTEILSSATTGSGIIVNSLADYIEGIHFNATGTKIFIISRYSIPGVYAYDLSVAWDTSTIISASRSVLFTSSQEYSPTSLHFSNDGLNLYIGGKTGIHHYQLSVAYGLSSATYITTEFATTPADVETCLIYFKSDGTKMYRLLCLVANTSVYIEEYTLSTSWDISTTTLIASNYIGNSNNDDFYGLFFKPDGTKMYVASYYIFGGQESINEYNLSTPWSISPNSISNSVTPYETGTSTRGIFFKPDGSKMYVGGYTSSLFEYQLSIPWNIRYYNYLYVGNRENSPYGLFFKPDGTKLYVTGTVGDDVNEYDLSVAWDITTAVYSQVFYVGSQESSPAALFFKPDGTKMYVMGTTGDDVNEYDLSVAWDVSSAVYSQVFSIAAQESNPYALFFKPDGTKMYVTGSAGDNVNEYDLSVAWDVSSAVYSQVFSVIAQEISPAALFFKPDGTKMYVMGTVGDDVNEYDLSIPWNVSSAVYLQVFSIAAQESNPYALFFKPDGTKMYVMGITADTVFEYNIGA